MAVWPLIMHRIYTHHRFKFRGKECSKQLAIFLAMIPMFIMIGFRAPNMGADTGTYIRHFESVVNTPLDIAIANTRMETGYIIFIKFIGTYITQEPLGYQLICTLIYFLGVFSFANQQEDKDAFLFIYFFCTLGLFTFMFTGVRQCIAISICLLAYPCVKKNQLIRFLVCVLLAFFFHKSALLFVFVYFIRQRKITFYNVMLYGVLVWLSTLYLESIQSWFNEQFEYDYAIEETGSGGIFLLILLMLTIFSGVCLRSQMNINENIRTLFNINFIAIFFWILRLFTRVAERPSYYFLFFSCALVAFSLNRITNTRKHVLLKIVIIGLALLLYYYRMRTNFVSLVPYRLY